MSFTEIIHFCLNYFYKNPYEFWGFITSVICVWLNTRENIWGWFFAIVAAGFYIKVFYEVRLMGDVLLQIVFIVVSIYGCYEWLYGDKGNNPLKVSRTPLKIILPASLIFIVSVVLTSLLLKWMNGDIIYLDATTTVISLFAQWMMARKYLENWLVWIFVNIIYVGMYFYKAVYLTSFLYFIFLILATMGYFEWKKSMALSLSQKKTTS